MCKWSLILTWDEVILAVVVGLDGGGAPSTPVNRQLHPTLGHSPCGAVQLHPIHIYVSYVTDGYNHSPRLQLAVKTTHATR